MPPRLAETDLDRLEHYLNVLERADSTMPLDMVQGMFAAVASAPDPIAQGKWLAEVLGESHEFATAAEAKEITGLLTAFAEDTACQLNGGEGFDFILYGEDEDLSAWAEGYLVGVDLADPPWDDGADPEDLDNMLFPFLALAGEARRMAEESGEEWMAAEEETRMLSEIRDGLANHLLDVRQYWFDRSIPPTMRRDAPKVGRNDTCPCGSGKKYKNCHGA